MYTMLVLLGLAALLGKSGIPRCLTPTSRAHAPRGREAGDTDALPHLPPQNLGCH